MSGRPQSFYFLGPLKFSSRILNQRWKETLLSKLVKFEWCVLTLDGNIKVNIDFLFQRAGWKFYRRVSLEEIHSVIFIAGWASCLHVTLKWFRKRLMKMVIYTQFSSLSRVRLCNPMNHSMPRLPVHHQLPEFTQTHAHWVGDAIQPSHPLSSPSPPAPNPSQHQGLFQVVNSLHEVAKVLEFQLQHQSFQWTPRTDLL